MTTPRCLACHSALEQHPSLPALWRCMFTLCDRYDRWLVAARGKPSKMARKTAVMGAFIKAGLTDEPKS